MKQVFIRVVLFSIFMLATLNVWAENAAVAQRLIKETTNEVLEALKADPSQVHKLVNDIVLPHFDFEKMSQYVLGKNWKNASKDQQDRFIEAFRNLLVRTYSTALVTAAGKVSDIKFFPKDTKKSRAEILTKVYQKGKSVPIEVNYYMYYNEKEWKVYNIKVGGVSLITNYRSEFAKDFKNIGMEGLIEKIKTQEPKKVN